MNRLAEELTQELGCPVEVNFVDLTREVIAVAHPGPDREVRVNLPVSLIALGLLDNSYSSVRHGLLNQLRLQLFQQRSDH